MPDVQGHLRVPADILIRRDSVRRSLFHRRTAPGQHPLPIWRKLVPRKSRLETKSENEARSALLARLWCHLILENPANRAENPIRLCSATIGRTEWRMGQFGAIRSRLETLKNRAWIARGEKVQTGRLETNQVRCARMNK